MAGETLAVLKIFPAELAAYFLWRFTCWVREVIGNILTVKRDVIITKNLTCDTTAWGAPSTLTVWKGHELPATQAEDPHGRRLNTLGGWAK